MNSNNCQIAERMNEIRVPYDAVCEKMQSDAEFKRRVNLFFEGKVIMVWDSKNSDMSFRKVSAKRF